MDPNDIHDSVSKAYSDALRKSKDTATSAAKVAGYGDEAAAHGEAAASSFGCGNPLAFAGVTEGQTVVDLGSGAGFDLLIASDKVGPSGRVIGVDMTDAMIDEARSAAARAGRANIDVRKGLIEDLPVDSASADWVISNCVINLSPDKPKVFAEIARVLKPGGRFSISDIVAEGLPPAIVQSAAAYSACVAGAVSEADYLAGLRSAGFVDVDVRDRLVYDADQIRAVVASDLEAFGLDAAFVEAALPMVVGKVWSVKVVGTKPAT